MRTFEKKHLSRLDPASAGLMLLVGGLAIFWLWSGWMYGRPFLSGRSDIAANQLAFEEVTGVRVLRAAVVAGGGMIDIQYLVVDPDKAVVVHDDESPPAIIDQKSGRSLDIPFHEHSDTDFRAGGTYHELLVNPNGILRPGAKISILIGGFRLENLIIE